LLVQLNHLLNITFFFCREEAARLAAQLETAVPHALLDEAMHELSSLRQDALLCSGSRVEGIPVIIQLLLTCSTSKSVEWDIFLQIFGGCIVFVQASDPGNPGFQCLRLLVHFNFFCVWM
jgi:hypothetical protein